MESPRFKLSFCLFIGIQIISCAFLFDAFRRIIGVTRKIPHLTLNVKAMLIHTSSYVLYLVSLIFFFVVTFTFESTEKSFFISECSKAGITSLSLIVLTYVFWSIHKMSLKGEQPQEELVGNQVNQTQNTEIENRASTIIRKSTH